MPSTTTTAAFAFKVVILLNGAFKVLTAETEDQFVTMMAEFGHKLTGRSRSAHTRAELQDRPVFAGLAGPMWDGGPIRYECPNACRALSE